MSLNTVFKLASDEAVPSVSLLDGLKTDNVDPEFALVSNVNVKRSKELFFNYITAKLMIANWPEPYMII